MKIAVTGASGFLGQHVIAELLKRNYEVVAIIRSPKDFIYKDQCQLVKADLASPETTDWNQLKGISTIIHLAWDGLPNYLSLHHYEKELPRQYRFLKQLVEIGTSKLCVSGTCAEYGMRSGALSEDTPCTPSNPYGFAKNALREQLVYLQKETPFQLTWARFFYLYGKGQSANSLYTQFQSAVENGDKTFAMSQGDQLRDFLPVEIAARHLVELALLKQDTGSVNVCAGKPTAVRTLVEEWNRSLDNPLRLKLGVYPYPSYESIAFWGNSEKLNQLLDTSINNFNPVKDRHLR
ncbi:MAG: NAD(P)-dependent oxidoreductase [Candidatus Sedimenticola sp. 6PFRAG1]